MARHMNASVAATIVAGEYPTECGGCTHGVPWSERWRARNCDLRDLAPALDQTCAKTIQEGYRRHLDAGGVTSAQALARASSDAMICLLYTSPSPRD